MIQSELNLSDNVADIVAATMKRLPEMTQCALMVASCLGAVIPEKVLSEFFRNNELEDKEIAHWVGDGFGFKIKPE